MKISDIELVPERKGIFDVEIDGKTYVTDDLKNGIIYDCDSDGEILENEDGDWIKIGYFK